MTDTALVDDAVVEARDVSVWIGQKVALSGVSCSFGPGVTGLLGPNGAGKSTLMRLIAGLTAPRSGTVRVGGLDPAVSAAGRRNVGWVPEDDAVPGRLTTRQLVEYVARLHGVCAPAAADAALAAVDLTDQGDRRLADFSKGLRQRAKIAAALVTDPQVLVLDEPLNGADPVQRVTLIDLFRRLGAEGRTVIVSSHVLPEVERLADRVLVLVGGRLAASGDHRAIRDAMDGTPRRVLVRTDAPRPLAAALLGFDAVVGVQVAAGEVVISTVQAGSLALTLAPVAVRAGARLSEVRPLDDDLDAMFRELVR